MAPTLLPKRKREERRVFLEPELWRELDHIAEFHTEVFSAMGADEKVSRNDVIAAFLQWAVDAYWQERGGRPTSDRDRTEKVRRHAEQLKRELKDSSK